MMRKRKKKEETPPVAEVSLPEIKSFSQFYNDTRGAFKDGESRHVDWYMIGGSPDQYPNVDNTLEDPEESYSKYKKQMKDEIDKIKESQTKEEEKEKK